MIGSDFREKRSGIPDELKEEGVEVFETDLSLGDYKIFNPLNELQYLTHVTVIPEIKEKDSKAKQKYSEEVINLFIEHIDDLYGLLIENKIESDFVTSLKSRHLNEQLWRQSVDYYSSILIFQGNLFSACKKTGFNYYNALLAINAAIMKRANEGKRGNISVITTKNNWETTQHLKAFDQYVMMEKKIIREWEPVRELSKKNMNRNLQVTVASIPDVGDKRAKWILEGNPEQEENIKFPSLEDLFFATSKDIQKIKGIGKKTAESIINYFVYKYGTNN